MKQLIAELSDIAERAEMECDYAARSGEKMGNYYKIAKAARRALKIVKSSYTEFVRK